MSDQRIGDAEHDIRVLNSSIEYLKFESKYTNRQVSNIAIALAITFALTLANTLILGVYVVYPALQPQKTEVRK